MGIFKICRRNSDLNFAVTFLEHSVYNNTLSEHSDKEEYKKTKDHHGASY